jgi:hypothetical protein
VFWRYRQLLTLVTPPFSEDDGEQEAHIKELEELLDTNKKTEDSK